MCGGLLLAQKSPLEIHRHAIVIDTHIDTPQRLLDENLDLGPRSPDGHIDIPRMREGGLDAAFFSIWVEPKYEPHFTARALALIDGVLDQVEKHPKDLELAFTAADIRRAQQQGKIAILMGVEGGHAIEDNLRVLDTLYRLGVRYMTLTWSNSTSWAGSSGDTGRDRGLTAFGREVVLRMNQLGMMVDISHVSDPTFWDVVKVSKAPIIASHSSARALNNVPRNVTDEMIRAVAQKGGVVQVNYYTAFLDGAYLTAWNKVRDAYNEQEKALVAKYKGDPGRLAREKRRLRADFDAKLPVPPLSRIVDHIDHIAKLAGVDHVGLGSDFDGAEMPRGMEDVSKLPALTAELVRRGYKESDIAKILGGNLLRVMEQVERARTASPRTGVIR